MFIKKLFCYIYSRTADRPHQHPHAVAPGRAAHGPGVSDRLPQLLLHVNDLVEQVQLNTVLYADSINLTKYDRHMVIGYK